MSRTHAHAAALLTQLVVLDSQALPDAHPVRASAASASARRTFENNPKLASIPRMGANLEKL